MLKAALAFIPLLSGYIFVSTWLRTRYQIQRDNSQKVYFRAAFWGIWFFLLSFGLATYFRGSLNPVLVFFNTWREQAILTDGQNVAFNSIFWLVCLGGTLLLGMTSGYVFNLIVAIRKVPLGFYAHAFTGPEFKSYNNHLKHNQCSNQKAIVGSPLALGYRIDLTWLLQLYRCALLVIYWLRKLLEIRHDWYGYAKMYQIRNAIYDFNSEVEIMLLRALEYTMPVFVTTPSKVYVGYVMGSIEAESKRESLRILPVISGYREEPTRKVVFTTSYMDIYGKFNTDQTLEHLRFELFEVVISADDIKTISLFDVKAYLAFQEIAATDPDQLELKLLNLL